MYPGSQHTKDPGLIIIFSHLKENAYLQFIDKECFLKILLQSLIPFFMFKPLLLRFTFGKKKIYLIFFFKIQKFDFFNENCFIYLFV